MRQKLQTSSSKLQRSYKTQPSRFKEAPNFNPQDSEFSSCISRFKKRSMGISYASMRTTEHQKVAPKQSAASPLLLEPQSKKWGTKPNPEMLPALHEESTGKQVERHRFDLEERTAVFGEQIVQFSKRIPRDPTNDPLRAQLVRCGTSIGANYYEATEGVSKKDFRHPVSRCVKEAKETKFFLRMVVAAEPQLTQQARVFYKEANELMLIFASIYRK